MAQNPLGPWIDTKIELNPQLSLKGDHKIKGQNSYVIRVALSDDSVGYVFASDLWSSAADNLKSHDLQYWHLLQFNESDPLTAPKINGLVWEDYIQLDQKES